MTTEQIYTQSPLMLDEGETLEDILPEIAAELLRAPEGTHAAAAMTLRLIGDQLSHIGGATPAAGSVYAPKDTGNKKIAVIVGGELMNEKGFKTEEAAYRFLQTLLADSDPDDFYVTDVYDNGDAADELPVEMYGADIWLDTYEENAREPTPSSE